MHMHFQRPQRHQYGYGYGYGSSSSSGGKCIPFSVCFWSTLIWNSSVWSEIDFKFAFYREIELKEKLNIIKKGKKAKFRNGFFQFAYGMHDVLCSESICFNIPFNVARCTSFLIAYIGFHGAFSTIADKLNGASYTTITSQIHHFFLCSIHIICCYCYSLCLPSLYYN